MFPIRFQLPASLFVFYRAVIMLELGIALLARLVVLTVLIETGDSEPGSICTGLTSLRVEAHRKRILTGKGGTIALEVILTDALLIHPQTETRISDELHHANGVVDSGVLRFVCIHLVLVDEHPLAFPGVICDSIQHNYAAMQEVKPCPRNARASTLRILKWHV